MLIDNLKDINSVSDLFVYICKIEEESEYKSKQIDRYLNELSKMSSFVDIFIKEAGYKNAYFSDPIEGHQLRVYATPTNDDNCVIGEFLDAYYYEGEGYRLARRYAGYCVRYWKDVNSSDCECEG